MSESLESKHMDFGIDERLEAARARLETQFAAAAIARERDHRAMNELRTVSKTIRSEGGECTVTSAADGKILDVTLAGGFRTDARLSSVLTDTISRAQAAARSEAADRASTLFGETFPLVSELRKGSNERGWVE